MQGINDAQPKEDIITTIIESHKVAENNWLEKKKNQSQYEIVCLIADCRGIRRERATEEMHRHVEKVHDNNDSILLETKIVTKTGHILISSYARLKYKL